MNGIVDPSGRSLISVQLSKTPESNRTSIDVWIDTGFTGELVLSQSTIALLTLEKSGSIDAVLADGSQVELDTYSCSMEWFGNIKSLEIIANEGEYPLLGVGLLLGLELRIDYHNLRLQLLPASPDSA